MIRPGQYTDIPKLVPLMLAGHARSKYAERCGVDIGEAKSLFAGALQRTQNRRAGGACLFVSDSDGTITGLLLGALSRVYEIGTKLMATDVFFYVTEAAEPRDFIGLFDSFEAWAQANPDVIEIKPGITDIVGDPERLAKFYERRGYTRCGAIFQRSIER